MSFALVMEADEVRRHVPEWPERALLAALHRDGVVVSIAPVSGDESLAGFVGGLPVVPFRRGYPSMAPDFDMEIAVMRSALTEAASRLAAGTLSAPVLVEDDQFDEFEVSTTLGRRLDAEMGDGEEMTGPAMMVRRTQFGLEFKLPAHSMSGWPDDKLSVGGSTFGLPMTGHHADLATVYEIATSDLGALHAVARFIPKRWAQVSMTDGPAGPQVDLSGVVLDVVSRQLRMATILSAAAIIVAVGTAVAAITVWVRYIPF